MTATTALRQRPHERTDGRRQRHIGRLPQRPGRDCQWKGGPDVAPNVAWARQSLTPIVWNGKLNPLLDTDPNSPQWGYTLGGVTRVWRTAVGIDRRGNLIYVVANYQTVISIAQILVHAGAVRGMEFDINPEWHTLITYTHQHGLVPTMVEPQPMQSRTVTWSQMTATSWPCTGVFPDRSLSRSSECGEGSGAPVACPLARLAAHGDISPQSPERCTTAGVR